VKGVNLAIDDFGTGYSSLTQLVRMPFNEIKIDRSLILEVPHAREARVAVDAFVKLGHTLDLTVCAEGVETHEALEFLDSVRCDCAQGFFIGRPAPATDIPEMVH
jgi:EAL domain-containing protein (putative c-di-GMP-specific phosphodiesterase class I)